MLITNLLRAILSLLAFLHKSVELKELWRQQLYYEVPYYSFFIVQISIMFQIFQTFKAIQETNVEKMGEILGSKKYKIILSVLIGVVVSFLAYETVYISLYG